MVGHMDTDTDGPELREPSPLIEFHSVLTGECTILDV